MQALSMATCCSRRCCGAPRYLDGVSEAATAKGWPDEAMHREYFSVPEEDGWVNREFELHRP